MTAAFASKLVTSTIEAQNWSRQLGPQRKNLIVLHSIECNEKGDSAEATARWFQRQSPTTAPRSSAHFCVDVNSVVQCVPAERIAWHAPGVNTRAIGIEHAGWHYQSAAQWLDEYSRAMLTLSARLCAELVLHFKIPCVFLDAAGIREELAGITTHEQVTRAYPEKGSHMDPGRFFPLRWYLDEVRKLSDGSSA